MITPKKIVNVPLEKVRGNALNPRQITEKNYKRLLRDVQNDPQFIASRPLLAYKDSQGVYVVYAGNMRLRALQELGYKQVPIIDESDEVLDAGGNIIPEVINKRIFIDNENYGQYDFELLANNFDLGELELMDLPELTEMLPHALKDDINDRMKAESQAETGDGMSTYSIVLVYEEEKYMEMFEKFDKFKKDHELESNNDVIDFLFNAYEKSNRS